MPSVSQSQRGLIFSKRGKYGSEEKTPKKWKWVWHEGWENPGKLPKKKRKKSRKKIHTFESFINESNNTEKKVNDLTEQELKDENSKYVKLQNSHRLTPHDERRWKKISSKLNEKD